MKPRVLVTGSSGFVGSHVVSTLELQGKAEVVGIDKRPGRLNHGFIHADLRHMNIDVASEICEATHVIHLAADAYVPLSLSEPRRYVENNVDATVALLGALAQSTSLRRFILVSTCEVYGAVAEEADESTPVAPASPYAASKASQELFASAAQQYQSLPLLIARLFNNFGPGQQSNRLVPSVIRAIRTDEVLSMTGDGLQTRDWIDVRDTAESLVRLCFADDEIAGETFNVCAGQELRVAEVISMFSEAAGRTPVVRSVPQINGFLRRSSGSSRKLRELIGWEPRRTLAQFSHEVFSTRGGSHD